jgi:pimeloyl-ACP methyl ester carboxylesterase
MPTRFCCSATHRYLDARKRKKVPIIKREMQMNDRQIARRTLLTQTGLGLATVCSAAFGSGLESAAAKAGPGGDVRSAGRVAKKGEVKLALYRKWPGNLGGSPDKPLPVLFLVHGSSLSARSSFDLDVPGSEYSMMNVFARSGFDVWTMDHEGFGRSEKTSGTSDIASRVEDLKAAMATVQQETGRSKVHMFGESSGSIAAARGRG